MEKVTIFKGVKKIVTYEDIYEDVNIEVVKEFNPCKIINVFHKKVEVEKIGCINGVSTDTVHFVDGKWQFWDVIESGIREDWAKIPATYTRSRKVNFSCGHSHKVYIMAKSKDLAEERIAEIGQGKCDNCKFKEML